MDNVFPFPKPKRVTAKIVLETDFQFLVDNLMKMTHRAGYGKGFIVGVLLVNGVHLFTDIIFKYYL